MTDDADDARLGHQAANELRLTETAFAAVKADYVSQMIAATDPAVILDLHKSIATVDRARQKLVETMNAGLIAQARQDRS